MARKYPLDPLISDHPKLLPVFFVEMSWAFLMAAHEEIEELLCFILDQLPVVPLLDQARVTVVFVTGQFERFLPTVAPHEVGQFRIKQPDRLGRQGRRLTVTLEGVGEVTDFLIPFQMRAGCKGYVLRDLVGFAGMVVTLLFRLANFARVVTLFMPNFGNRRDCGRSKHRRPHLPSQRFPNDPVAVLLADNEM